MNITKQITVIDKATVKVGDKLRFKRNDFENTLLVMEIMDTYLVVKFEDGIKYKMMAKDLGDYIISKVESKTSKFSTGQLYRVEDTNSCDKFDVLIMTASDSEITALKLKSATAISIKESEIDARYKFTKIKTVEENKTVTLLHGKDKDEWFDILCKEFENCNETRRPFFSGYKPSFYFKTDSK